MTGTRIFLITLIFVIASMAWMILGQTITHRTKQSEEALKGDVDRMFGPRVVQDAPRVTGGTEKGGKASGWRSPDASEIEVTLDHENRYRGLVWFSVYRVTFDGTYTLEAPKSLTTSGTGSFKMELPDAANIDALAVAVNGKPLAVDSSQIDAVVPLAPGTATKIHVHYVTSGQDAWEYKPDSSSGGLRNFKLTARTNFEAIDYPTTGLSPTEKARPRGDGGKGLEAVWDYSRMLPARNHTIGLVMPSMPASGKLSARIALFAPVSLFFFFGVMVMIQVLKGWRLHPMNYLLIAAGFFAFHILLAYLVDHWAIHLSFWIAALVSVFLVVSYLRLVLGAREAVLVAGLAQLIYLVFFSYAFFWEGWTGLTVVIGAILTLFVIMQMTGRIDWEAVLKPSYGKDAKDEKESGTVAAPASAPSDGLV